MFVLTQTIKCLVSQQQNGTGISCYKIAGVGSRFLMMMMIIIIIIIIIIMIIIKTMANTSKSKDLYFSFLCVSYSTDRL